MFRELVPYLRHRSVLFTVTDVGEDHLRVNVVPQKLKDGENEALTTPLSITGTAEQLDADLPKTLVDYVAAHLQLKNTLESAKAQMDAAAKAAQEEAKAKTKATGKGAAKPSSSSQSISAETPSTKPVEVIQPPKPASPSLFDFDNQVPAPTSTSEIASSTTEEEILSEVDDADEDNSGELEEAA